jgi:hypothetical protein
MDLYIMVAAIFELTRNAYNDVFGDIWTLLQPNSADYKYYISIFIKK